MSMLSGVARTPKPPYAAVVFASRQTAGDHGDGAMATRMEALGATDDDFLGLESVRGTDGVRLSASYWRDEAAIRAWKREPEHQQAQRRGRTTW